MRILYIAAFAAVAAANVWGANDVCGDAYSTPDTCDADSKCTWCKCGAMPSACWTLENAKKLPAGVYACTKNATQVKPVPAPVAAANDVCGDAYSTPDTCNADSKCTWCKCGAMPSACWTLENAKKLPAGVYVCTKNATRI